MATKVKTDPAPVTTIRVGRLAGKVALVTGAAGNLGGEIARHYLNEGATVVFTGRTAARINAAAAAARADTGASEDQTSTVVMDGADAASCRAGIAEILSRHGRIDILVNNAGSAGPKQPLERLPLSRADLEALQADGATDTETVGDAARNILGVAWNMVRAAAGAMAEGGSIINVSTIFSRTHYYGRTAYTVPKAALNALSRELSLELGPRGIRVNLVFPGPIASERIRTVFAAMDAMRGDDAGTTASQFFDLMSFERSVEGAPRAKTFPTPRFRRSRERRTSSRCRAAFNGHDFEVTHGMTVRKESRSTYLSRPTMRSIDGGGLGVVIAAGTQVAEAIAIARVQADCGAEVLLGFIREVEAIEARLMLSDTARITVVQFDRADHDMMDRELDAFTERCCAITGAIIMPAYGADHFTGTLADASDEAVDEFVDRELVGSIAVARTLSRYWKRHDSLVHDPRFIFMGNGSDGGSDIWTNFHRAMIEQLVRVWRDESEVDVEHGRRRQLEWGNQIVRFGNREPENLPFAAGQAARTLLKERKIQSVNLYLPPSIGEATGARKAMVGFSENITGLHLGKVALITGGSAGIGGQVARLLALAGAKVMIVARRESELATTRARIVGELEDVGFSGVERRVRTLSGIDVGNLATLQKAVDETIKAFGRIDYLINNAGVSGAEEMVVDMSVDAWRYTLNANLISNYALMHMVVPGMKAQGSGYILNVSSYFGGEKYLAVAYPNRADYAVSKSGQRAMAETMGRFLGPEVQINAIAPGPVDGDRLSGKDGKAGLFDRRGKLILENKRLNAVHAATVKSIRRGVRVEAVLTRLARNDIAQMAHDTNNPRELRDLALDCARAGTDDCTWGRFLMAESMATRLVARLRLGGYFLDSPLLAGKPDDGWLLRIPPDDLPFLPSKQIAIEAGKVGNGVLSLLHLGKMPTESEVAQATVFFLADRAVSGETFMPSGGLNVERSNTERELFGSPKQERLDQMRGRTVWLIGEYLVDYLAETARAFVEQCHVAKVVLMTRTAEGAAAITAHLDDLPAGTIVTQVCDTEIEPCLDAARTVWGAPTTIVSTPFAGLPDTLFETGNALTPEAFAALIEDNLTHHFRVARKASLIDQTQLVLVSPDVSMDQKGPAFALANFFKTTLHAFTATLAVENERLVHDVPVNQINLTRRVRSEEPRNLEEHLEEVKRFARAVLLAGAPLPDAEDSRYRARIYRGTSITV
jgi:malonyl-CoA reductase/3-hydroxypropionate dehydrogenase (NADP+)